MSALCLSQSRFHLSPVGPSEKKKNTAKGKEAFQGKVVVLDSLVNFFGKTFPISAIHSRLQE